MYDESFRAMTAMTKLLKDPAIANQTGKKPNLEERLKEL